MPLAGLTSGGKRWRDGVSPFINLSRFVVKTYKFVAKPSKSITAASKLIAKPLKSIAEASNSIERASTVIVAVSKSIERVSTAIVAVSKAIATVSKLVAKLSKSIASLSKGAARATKLAAALPKLDEMLPYLVTCRSRFLVQWFPLLVRLSSFFDINFTPVTLSAALFASCCR
jgi:ABC-type transporter Mla subunit MlaD